MISISLYFSSYPRKGIRQLAKTGENAFATMRGKKTMKQEFVVEGSGRETGRLAWSDASVPQPALPLRGISL